MKITNLSLRSRYFSVLGIVILLGAVFITVNSANQAQRTSSNAATSTNCTPNAILVNPCRPWFGGAVLGSPKTASDPISQFTYLEGQIGHPMDIFHDYHPVGNLPLNSDELHFAKRANTYIYVNWKPASTWAQANGSNATVNAQIDKAAANIKAIAPTKIFLTIWHEPENDVSPGTSSCPGLKGGAGSPADYKAMWQNVHDRFATDGVSNVVWVMNYMGYAAWDCLVPQMWPGNNLVDWVTYDSYSSSDSSTWSNTIGRFYTVLTADSNSTTDFTSKPWGLGEWGDCATKDQAHVYSYYQQAKAALDANTYPRLKMYLIFASTTGPGAGLGCLPNYSASGTYDPTEQSYFNQFANDPIFAAAGNPVIVTPIPTSAIPTPTKTPTPFVPTPKPTALPTIRPTSTPTVPPTAFPTAVPQSTSTPVPGDTTLVLTVGLQGIGDGGDNVNPNAQGNTHPRRSERQVTVEIYDTQNQLVVTQQTQVTYDSASGAFVGTLDLGNQFLSGPYLIKIKTDQYLRQVIPGIQIITAGQTKTLPTVTLVTGDINGDNAVNIEDFNILIGCYSDLLPPANCPAGQDVVSDLNDDGHVNQIDYNLFLRELTNVSGQ